MTGGAGLSADRTGHRYDLPGSETPRVLIFVEYYLPGFRAGGPLRSISGLVSRLGGQFDFRIITRCHDDGETEPYRDVHVDQWNPVGRAQVFYASTAMLTMAGLADLVQQTSPDILYLNSCFGPMTIRLLVARRRGRVPRLPLVLAPRGEFSTGALRLKKVKKRLFLMLAARSGLFDDIVWQASSPLEQADILKTVGGHARIKVAIDLLAESPPRPVASRPVKRPGTVRFIFVSRIDRKKNLDFALRLLPSLHGNIAFDIYGPISDVAYWAECEERVRRLPRSVEVTYHGAIPHHAVAGALARAHFLVLPTRGENFGHVIVEAFLAGCPVLTSDQTPWIALSQRGAGWDLALGDTDAWRQVLQVCIDMDAPAYERTSINSRTVGNQALSTDTVAENLRLFQSAFEQYRGRGAVAEL